MSPSQGISFARLSEQTALIAENSTLCSSDVERLLMRLQAAVIEANRFDIAISVSSGRKLLSSSRPRTSNSMRVLGNGAMSTVFRAIDRRTGEPVAYQGVQEARGRRQVGNARNGVMIHAELRHPNVLGLLGNFERDDAVILVLEYASIIQQTASALEYCHSKRICPPGCEAGEHPGHRQWSCEASLTSASATSSFPARRHVVPRSDMYELLVGRLPFELVDATTFVESVASGHYMLPSELSIEAMVLIRRLLVVDPEARFTAQQVLADPWMATNANVLPRGFNPFGSDIEDTATTSASEDSPDDSHEDFANKQRAEADNKKKR
ncbi:hypothetical protein COOONC_01538 [Cooperia oncophora]